MAVSNKGSGVQMSEYDAVRKRREIQTRAEAPTKRTSTGLRDALFDEIDALRRGDGDPQRATAIARLSMNILASAKFELEVRKAGIPSAEEVKSVQLGAPEEEPSS